MVAPEYTKRVTEAFGRFWAVYPWRKINPRARALAEFAKLVEGGEDPEVLVAAAGRFAEVIAAEKVRSIFIPHARTWLHLRDFEDYLEPEAPAPADDAQPAPEPPAAHPMDWARPLVTTGAWASWFARLTVSGESGAIVITAPTGFVRDRVNQDYRPLFARHFGAVTWRIEGQD